MSSLVFAAASSLVPAVLLHAVQVHKGGVRIVVNMTMMTTAENTGKNDQIGERLRD
jgi:hypothetical protein